jgi:peptidoglycan/xylan/chitin deacetylase (PgdA/CDA1 family)
VKSAEHNQFKFEMSTANLIKRSIKRGMQYFAATFGPHTRTATAPQLLILMYHRILPYDDARTRLEEPGMVVTPTTFQAHLATLSQYFEFVSLADWLERRATAQPLPAKACAITFDDGWVDNYEFAFPILQTLNIPATIFVVAEMIGTHRMFWPEQLARLASTISERAPQNWSDPSLAWLRSAKTDFTFSATTPTTEQITQLIAHAKQHTDTEIYAQLRQAEQALGISLAPAKASLLDWEQIATMMDAGPIEIGSHTCNHIRLNTKTPAASVEREILDSKRIIEQKTGRAVKTFCFPNGDYSEYALNLVKANYAGAVTTDSGWNTLHTDSYLLQRIGVHEDISSDRTAFLSRISGWI